MGKQSSDAGSPKSKWLPDLEFCAVAIFGEMFRADSSSVVTEHLPVCSCSLNLSNKTTISVICVYFHELNLILIFSLDIRSNCRILPPCKIRLSALLSRAFVSMFVYFCIGDKKRSFTCSSHFRRKSSSFGNENSLTPSFLPFPQLATQQISGIFQIWVFQFVFVVWSSRQTTGEGFPKMTSPVLAYFTNPKITIIPKPMEINAYFYATLLKKTDGYVM